jgi:DNA-3-methyladenine glycosylase
LTGLNFDPLPESFYKPSAEAVAPKLLGHWLIRNTPQGPVGGPIVETEAYLADDPASHGFIGKTPRNRSLYGIYGRAYVYLIYGFHYCFNAVCRPKGTAEAVLIRAIEVAFGEEFMRGRRPVPERHQLTNGPGKLCAALDIDREIDGPIAWTRGGIPVLFPFPNRIREGRFTWAIPLLRETLRAADPERAAERLVEEITSDPSPEKE